MNEEKYKTKVSPKEQKFRKIKRYKLLNNKIKDSHKTTINLKENKNNFNLNNNNTEIKYSEKSDKRNIKHINLKNIIKKIDLFSLSLKKKSKIVKKISRIKEKKTDRKDINSNNLITLIFDKDKTKNNTENMTLIRNNSKYSKNNSYQKVNHTVGNLTEHKSKKKSKGNNKKIRISKLYIKKLDKDNYFNYDNNDNFLKKSTKRNTTSNLKLYKFNNNDIIKIKKSKLNKSGCSNEKENNLDKNESKKFIRNKSELVKFNLNIKDIYNSEYSPDKNNNKNNIKKKNKKQNYVSKVKELFIIIDNTKNKDEQKNGILNDKNSNRQKELKDYILKRKGNENMLLLIKKNIVETDLNHKTKKVSYINRIPKPTTNINMINENKNYYNTKKKNNNNNYIENKKHLSTEMLNKKIQFLTPSPEKEYSKTNNENNIQNYLINNALINIREFSSPGKTINDQITLNQDSYIIKRDINYIKNFNIFAIFDGHGFYGHFISEYLKNNLIKKFEEHPKIKFLKNLKYIYSRIISDNYRIIREIFQELDNEILNNKELNNINLSGSTCTLLIQIGDDIICANIGDSKAILVYEDFNTTVNINDEYDKYKIIKLSKDCLPNIETEKMRILMNGGKIIQLKNTFNQELGPLRIFLKDKNIPGLSISRSFGDKIGKSIGVISNPIINEYKLNKDVKFIVIASGGIWRVMTEKELLDNGIKYYLMNNPDYFCKNIANISTELWKQNSGNVEDITIIVIFFSFI